jgi:hypothetical protein
MFRVTAPLMKTITEGPFRRPTGYCAICSEQFSQPDRDAADQVLPQPVRSEPPDCLHDRVWRRGGVEPLRLRDQSGRSRTRCSGTGGSRSEPVSRKLFSGASVSYPFSCYSQTQKEARKPGLFLFWCGRGDSNPHVLANASPSSWCVCQFRHFRKGEVSCRRAQDSTSVARRAAAPEPAARARVPASTASLQAWMPEWEPAESRLPIRCPDGRVPRAPARQP